MRLLWILATAGLAFAQLESDLITVTSSRTSSVVPEEMILSVSISADVKATLDDVLALVQGTGLTGANLVNAQGHEDQTDWTFSMSGPYSKLKDALPILARNRDRAGIVIQYRLQATSPPVQACNWPALLSDARGEAQRLATAAGGKVGPIVALSDAPVAAELISSAAVPVAVYDPSTALVYGGLGGIPSLVYGGLGGIPSPPACSLTVQFKLLR